MPNLESIAKEMFEKWTDGTFVWEMDKTEKSLWIKLARWHAKEVLKARLSTAEIILSGNKQERQNYIQNYVIAINEELKSLEVEK